ncbi:MAG: cation:proton antiporter [Planctomycetaceae bacterium]
MSVQPASSNRKRSRRTVSWRAIGLLAAITLVVWSRQFFASGTVLPAAFAAPVQGKISAAPPDQLEAAPGDDAEHAAAENSDAEHADAEHSGGHKDPVAEVLMAILIILLLAKIVGDVVERIGMPAVLGELAVGIILGNWAFLTGSHVFDFFKPSPDNADALTGNTLDILSRIGVVLLLFEVGLESRVKEMLSVGVSSLIVAILGVIAPMVLGFGVGFFLLSDSLAHWQVPAFLGATLCATSVGITARVLRDIGQSQARESKIILGAAVIDDVLGLIVLAVVSGVILEGEKFHVFSVVKIIGLSFAFLAAALILGYLQLPRLLFRAASVLRGHGLLVTTALVICFLFSWGANQVNLAPIIGAFAAGLILEGAHYQEVGEKWKNRRLEDALAPLSAMLIPIFFVETGVAVDFNAFVGPPAEAHAVAAETEVPGSHDSTSAGEAEPAAAPAATFHTPRVRGSLLWILAGGLTVVAILGKLVCAWGVREKGLNTLAVGIGMIPRGEVGLIFAGEGRRLTTPEGDRVVGEGTFAAIVVMVMVTTMITPPLLKWAMTRRGSESR